MSWTDERVELLKKMWAEGKSASQIAKELGSVTRNAVIGKVHRLGLSSRGADAAAVEAPAEPPAAEAPRPKAPVAEVRRPAEPEVQAPASAPDAASDEDKPAAPAPASTTIVHMPGRRPIVPAGQPLPPQPSAHEISPEALANVREVEKGARKLSLMELTERTCKWPIGDPATEEFWFCGLPAVAGKPYCEAHVSVAFQPMQSRRDRRR
ncbi:GcrA family cell cycle regulator [Pararhodobacter sp.]|uniref:GcrA family cell cycle regulator n=1 Tax=Pararhodobacter sp. TaxID=2127056 RepID=UPI002FDE272F